MHIHTLDKQSTCPQCEKTFKCKGSLKKHMLIHAGIKPFICSQCGKDFICESQLKYHMNIRDERVQHYLYLYLYLLTI